MPTLFVDRQYKRGLGGPWEVTDGATLLATGDDPVTHHRLHPPMHIETGGRQFTARRGDDEAAFDVSDDVTGERLVALRFTRLVHAGGRGEVATVNVASTGAALSWNNLPAERQLGFYETDGSPVMVISRRLDLQASEGHGVVRTLLRFWGSMVKAADRYQAQVTDHAVGRLVLAEELPILALFGVHLERTYNRRHAYIGD